MTALDCIKKRVFDVSFALIGLFFLWPLILLAIPFVWYSTGESGIFKQNRVGRYGNIFVVYKLRTMKVERHNSSTVTVANDCRITPFGAFLRRTKIDELPQLWNVIRGDMSFVGPRPDVPGFADRLEGESKKILNLRPGITGPATIKYRNEEELLSRVADPGQYNAEVVYPDKIQLNLAYLNSWTLREDINLILCTLKILPYSDELNCDIPDSKI